MLKLRLGRRIYVAIGVFVLLVTVFIGLLLSSQKDASADNQAGGGEPGGGASSSGATCHTAKYWTSKCKDKPGGGASWRVFKNTAENENVPAAKDGDTKAHAGKIDKCNKGRYKHYIRLGLNHTGKNSSPSYSHGLLPLYQIRGSGLKCKQYKNGRLENCSMPGLTWAYAKPVGVESVAFDKNSIGFLYAEKFSEGSQERTNALKQADKLLLEAVARDKKNLGVYIEPNEVIALAAMLRERKDAVNDLKSYKLWRNDGSEEAIDTSLSYFCYSIEDLIIPAKPQTQSYAKAIVKGEYGEEKESKETFQKSFNQAQISPAEDRSNDYAFTVEFSEGDTVELQFKQQLLMSVANLMELKSDNPPTDAEKALGQRRYGNIKDFHIGFRTGFDSKHFGKLMGGDCDILKNPSKSCKDGSKVARLSEGSMKKNDINETFEGNPFGGNNPKDLLGYKGYAKSIDGNRLIKVDTSQIKEGESAIFCEGIKTWYDSMGFKGSVDTPNGLEINYGPEEPKSVKNQKWDIWENSSHNEIDKSWSSRACVRVKRKKTKPITTFQDVCKNIADHTRNYGDTAAVSLVRNITKGGDWPTDSTGAMQDYGVNVDNGSPAAALRMTSYAGGKQNGVGRGGPDVFLYAKPYDNIQFRHILCYGTHAVESVERYPARRGESAGHHTDPVTFNFKSTPSNRLFGEDFRTTSGYPGSEREIKISTKTDGTKYATNLGKSWSSNLAYGQPSILKEDEYGIAITSPNDHKDNMSLSADCRAPESPNSPTLGGFSVPGRDKCRTTIQRTHDVGKEMKQQVSFKQKRAWVGLLNRSMYGGYCSCSRFKYSVPERRRNYYTGSTSGIYTDVKDYIRSGGCYSSGGCCCGENGCSCTYYSNAYDISYFRPLNQIEARGGAHHSRSVAVKIPYNFRNTFKGAPSIEGREEVVYSGEVVQPHKIVVKVNPRKNPDVNGETPYATITPKVKTKLISFIVNPDVQPNNARIKGGVEPSGGSENVLCSHFGHDGKCHIKDIPFPDKGNNRAMNQESNLYGVEEELVQAPAVTVPDVEVGTKFCVAAAVWPADSHGIENGEVQAGQDQSKAMAELAEKMGTSGWRISDAACRTIAKKPSVQVHAGGLHARSINTSTTAKIVGGTIDIDPDRIDTNRYPIRFFGSWAEHEIVTQGRIKGMASGAALGYNPANYYLGKNYPVPPFTNIELPGGTTVKMDKFCPKWSNLTMANSDCYNGVGYSNIEPDYDKGKRLANRYTNRTQPNEAKIPEDVITNKFTVPCRVGDTSRGQGVCLKNGGKYIRLGVDRTSSPMIKDELIIPKATIITDKFTNNTYTIDANGRDLTINRNICYGSCDNDAKVQYRGIAEVPQVLIFAKNINISSEVTRLDAWLIAEESINTCYQFRSGDSSSNETEASRGDYDTGSRECAKQLVVNGPVLSAYGKIILNRTAGAYPGKESWYNTQRGRLSRKYGGDSWIYKPHQDLSKDGSITAGEIFNLRPDAFWWAFDQSRRLTRATVTYRRELPVRY